MGSREGRVTAEIEFVSDPLVREFHTACLRQSKGTARNYVDALYQYYKNALRPIGLTLCAWVAEVKKESKSEDVKVRTKWARDLETYLIGYVSDETGRPYTLKSRKARMAGIRKFLYENVGQKALESYKFKLQSSEEELAAEKAKEDFVPISVEDYRKLVLGANTIRDRAILLTLPGMGVGEWLQFAHEWWKYADSIRGLKVPLKVNVVRPKNKRHYSVRMWDDALQYLQLLLNEREKEVGRPLGKDDHLFISTYGDKITGHRVQHMVRFLADKLGLEKREKGKIVYKFRPHEIGRDFFRTLCENLGVSEKVAEYSLGHKIDPNDYNKFHNTPDGQARIERELSKLRESLNVVSGKGNVAVKDLEKLEGAVNARFAEAEAAKKEVESMRRDLEELKKAVSEGGMKALRDFVEKQKERMAEQVSTGTRRFSNGHYDYIKTRVELPDFDTALMQGFEIVIQSPDGYVVLRKTKGWMETEGSASKVGGA